MVDGGAGGRRRAGHGGRRARTGPGRGGQAASLRQTAQYPGDLRRRYRTGQHQRVYARRGRIHHAQYRPYRQGRHHFHGLLRREQLHGGPVLVHHRPVAAAHRPVQGRRARRRRGPAGPRRHHRAGAQGARLRDRAVRQEPPGRPRRIPAHQARLRRILRQPLSPQRRGRARAAILAPGPQGSGGQGVQAARRHQGQRRRQDRGHRRADLQAHGDHRRRNRGRRAGLHRQARQGRQAILRVDEHHAHAHLYAYPARAPGQERDARQRLRRRHVGA
ncbi:Uncharacterised protein [Bordetella pertussis]|nr:Uncharacterised protein [Bordetella pertussis]CPO19889.1 Uncharacterised protein [Bordetella pertussis]CPQ11473.1 Uncharacterised protein [Bordetella pertussis]